MLRVPSKLQETPRPCHELEREIHPAAEGDGESAREGKVYLEKQPWAACPHQAFR